MYGQAECGRRRVAECPWCQRSHQCALSFLSGKVLSLLRFTDIEFAALSGNYSFDTSFLLCFQCTNLHNLHGLLSRLISHPQPETSYHISSQRLTFMLSCTNRNSMRKSLARPNQGWLLFGSGHERSMLWCGT